MPNYYDGMFSSKFEKCLRDKFQGLDTINEVRSDYVKKQLVERGIALESPFSNIFSEMDEQEKKQNAKQ